MCILVPPSYDIILVILVHAANVYIHKFTQWADASKDSETDFESMFFIFP